MRECWGVERAVGDWLQLASFVTTSREWLRLIIEWPKQAADGRSEANEHDIQIQICPLDRKIAAPSENENTNNSHTIITTIMKILFLLIVALTEVTSAASSIPHTLLKIRGGSSFKGDVETKWLIHGNHDRDMKLLKDFVFIDDNNRKWKAPMGFDVDGASIPRPLWTAFGSPYVGRYRRASVIHDYYCKDAQHHLATSAQVHRMFYEAMLCDNVNPIKAWTMYQGVKLGGPRWK